MTLKFALAAVSCAAAAFGQYTAAPSGPPPVELSVGVRDALQKDGAKVTGPSGVVCELWFLAAEPAGPKSTEDGVTLPMIPQGALLGALRFPVKGLDRRGQTIKAGVYTLRYGNYPVNGDHQGVAPQRDFLVMTPAADDTDAKATPTFEQLMIVSRKASNTPHPAVLSFWKTDGDAKPGSIDKSGDTDWVLQMKLGQTAISIIVVGTAGS